MTNCCHQRYRPQRMVGTGSWAALMARIISPCMSRIARAIVPVGVGSTEGSVIVVRP